MSQNFIKNCFISLHIGLAKKFVRVFNGKTLYFLRFFFLYTLFFIYLFIFHIFLKFIYLFIFGCVGSSPLWGLSLVSASGGHSSSRCAGPSPSWPLLLRSTGSRRAGSAVVAHGPSRSVACGILPDQGPNPCPLHWPADSQPLRHQGSPFWDFWLTLEWASGERVIQEMVDYGSGSWGIRSGFWFLIFLADIGSLPLGNWLHLSPRVIGNRLADVILADLVSSGREWRGLLRNACNMYRIFTNVPLHIFREKLPQFSFFSQRRPTSHQKVASY